MLLRPWDFPGKSTGVGCHFLLCYRELECKSRKLRDTWSNRQVWPWSTNWSRANRVSSKEHTGHRTHPFPTTQETALHMDITRWSILKSDWLCSLLLKMEKLKTAKIRPGADCRSNHELLIAKFRLKLKKVGKTTRRRQWHPTPVLLPGKSHGWRSLVGCSPWGR